jgi:2-dehydro-3-deoxyphosphooctonate aldolase (KDO 8-P synthase)
LDVAGALAEACGELGLPYVFKASFDKANRTSIESFRGPGLEQGLRTLQAVRDHVGVPVLTDIHEPAQAAPVAEVVDVLQVPAFLCRQTDLLVAAARTGLPVNVKKGQFMAPGDMAASAGKLEASGCDRILLTERGTTFGYHNLVVDMRGIPEMQKGGRPVVFDVTHSVQRPAAQGTCSGGDRELAPTLARAAVAAGADGVFIETHPCPDDALCDASTMLPTSEVRALLEQLSAIRDLVGEGR